MKKLKERRVVLKLSELVAYGEENDGEDEVGSADVPEDKELEGVVEGDKDVDEEGKEDDDEEFEPTKAIKPSRMFFYHTEYKKQIKLEKRCLIVDVIQTFKTLKPEPSNAEKRWFEEHPQFRHLFHMKLDANAKKKSSNHKVQELWMLLLRTTDVARRREVWFIVNGVPIRYGLREHTLISGLNCRNYPLGYKQFGDRKFVKRHFKEGEPIRLEDVKAKLVEMGPHRDRLKMMVLFFLGSVICAQTKVGPGANDVLEFFQRDVDDLLTSARRFHGRDTPLII